VYGNEYDRTKKPINEESKTDPLAIYPATKLCTESIIKLYSRLYKIPYLICRLTNVYDEHEDFNNKKKGGLNYMIMQAVKGNPLTVYKGGNFLRDYIYLDDVISATIFLEEKKIINDTYLIGFGKAVLFKDIINYLHEITGKKSQITQVDPPEFHKAVGINNFVADISKIIKLGWQPKITYQEGIKKIVDKYKSLLLTQ
jgi:nucleoside-diphosphate-sugar epimerase